MQDVPQLMAHFKASAMEARQEADRIQAVEGQRLQAEERAKAAKVEATRRRRRDIAEAEAAAAEAAAAEAAAAEVATHCRYVVA